MLLVMHAGTLELSHNVMVISSLATVNTYKNRVLRDGIRYLAEYLLGNPGEDITHIGVGDDPSPNNIQTNSLGNERFRKPFTTRYMNGDYPTYETFFTRDEANFNWREIGLYAGGTDELNTGRLIARVIVNENKNDNVTISLLWEFRITNT